MTRAISLLLLPLLAAGVVASPTQPIVEYGNVMHRSIIERRQNKVKDVIGKGLQNNLPKFFQWAADNLSYLLRAQDLPLKRQSLKPELNHSAKRVVLRFGPWSLYGTEETIPKSILRMDPQSTIIIRTLRGLPSNSAILSARPTLVYEDGSPASVPQGIYVHHFLIADMSKPSAPFALCPNLHNEDKFGLWLAGYALEAVGAGLVQVGNDAYDDPNIFMSKKDGFRSAFMTNSDDLFALQAEIVNYNPTNKTVFLNMELEYLDHKPEGYLDTSTVVVSATGCEVPGYRAPKAEKKFTFTSKDMAISQNGFIVNARGHLHDGGTALEIWKNDTMVCRSVPTYGKPEGAKPGAPDTIIAMSWCHDPVPLKKGDVLRVKSHYDLNKHEMRHGAGMEHGMHSMSASPAAPKGEGIEEMGIMTTNFAWEMAPDVGKDASKGQSWSQKKEKDDASGWFASLLKGSKEENALSISLSGKAGKAGKAGRGGKAGKAGKAGKNPKPTLKDLLTGKYRKDAAGGGRALAASQEESGKSLSGALSDLSKWARDLADTLSDS